MENIRILWISCSKKEGIMKKIIWKKSAAVFTAAMLTVSLCGCGKKESKDSFEPESSQPATVADGQEGSQSEGSFDPNSDRIRNKTSEIENILNNYFYFEQDPEKQEEAYFDGILNGMDDPYTVYYTPEEYEKLMEDDSGTYVGIGATVSKNVETNQIYIVKPLKGSPALEAGLLPGDVLMEVDGTEVTADMTLEEVVKIIRGTEGTEASLKVYREGETQPMDFKITRAVVENVTVEYEMLEGNVGYIMVSEFIENTPAQFKEGVDDLIGQGAKALVVDLRNNPGGLLTSVIDMLDYMVDDDLQAEGASSKGLLLETRDKNGKVLESFSCKDGHKVDIPMAVLVNGNSASASEIYTGVMKDYGLAVIVGTNTFGKGIVQSVMKLSDGSGIKFTVAKYFTPAGNDIHEVGIAPDKEVELNEGLEKLVVIPHDQDNQLQEALKELAK